MKALGMSYFIKPNENCVRLILRQLRLRKVKDFVQGHMDHKGWQSLDQRAGLAVSRDLAFPYISEYLQDVCMYVHVCKYSLLVWSSLVK